MSELKPCPWCGPGNSIVSAWFDTSSNRYRVNCGACGSSSGVPARDKSESAAIAAWNRRAAVVTEEMVSRMIDRYKQLEPADDIPDRLDPETRRFCRELLAAALETPDA